MINLGALLLLEWIAFVSGVISIKKLGKDGRFVIFFLGFVVLGETASYWARLYLTSEKILVPFINTLFNVIITAQCISLLLFFFRKTRYAYWKTYIIGFTGTVLFITVLQFFVSNVAQFNTFNYTLEAVFISACSLHYLFELMNSEEIENVTQDPFMYISIGLLLYYLVTLPFNSMRTYLYEAHRSIFYLYYYLSFGFNYFLYSIITVGILCTKKK